MRLSPVCDPSFQVAIQIGTEVAIQDRRSQVGNSIECQLESGSCGLHVAIQESSRLSFGPFIRLKRI